MADQLTQDELLAVIDRNIPDSYLDPIKRIGPGYELYQGFTKIAERASEAVANFERDGFIMSSKGGALATVSVVFYRTTAAAGAGSMLAGTLVRATQGGQVFRTVVDTAFGALDLETTAMAVAIGYGYEWNVKGEFVDPDGVSWPGEIDAIDLPLQDPVFFDPSVLVRNDADAIGGRPATLNVLGAERSVAQHIGESENAYRIRIRTLPDTVSPGAIRRQLTNYFRRYPGLFWRTIETWQHEYQECWDAPDLPPTSTQNYNANLFCYDDPRPPSPIQNRWLGENDYQGAFILEVAMPPPIQDYEFAYDDPMGDEVGVPSEIGVRAISALDAPELDGALAPAYDGSDVGADDFFRTLFDLLDEIKLAGVFVVIHIQEQG